MFLAFQLSDIITVPFGWLLSVLYETTHNYGIAMILFAVIVQLILMPLNAKSKKSMMKMSRLTPRMQAIQRKYADDPQRQNQAIQELQKSEGVSMGGGCLWSFIPILILFPLFAVIRQPITYILMQSADTAKQIVEVIKTAAPDMFTSNAAYGQVVAAQLIPQYADELRAAIEEGHKAGAKSCTHAQGMSGIKAALRAGIDSIEHGFYMDDWCFEWMKEHGTTFVPTLTAVYYTKFSEAGIPEFARKKVDAAYEDHLNTFRGAYKAGVNIALGTDAGTPNNYPNQTGFEMVLMEKAGMTKWDAIKAGTINSAKLVGVEKTHGTIEAGKKANFTVYTANPIEDMNNVMDCCMTVIGGEVVYKK